MKKILFILLLIPFLSKSQVVNTLPSINVTQYGVKNDSSDVTAAFRALVAALPWGSKVYFPSGTYLFSDSIHITKDIQIYGDGQSFVDSFYSYYTIRNGSTKLYFNSGTKNFFVVDTGTVNRPPTVTFQDLSLLNTNYLSTAGNAFLLTGGTKMAAIRGVTIRGFFNHINVYAAINTYVQNCLFWAPAKKVLIQDNVTQTDAGGTFFLNNQIFAGLSTTNPPDTAFMIHGAGAIYIRGNNFNSQIPFTSAAQYACFIASDWSSGTSSDIWIQDNTFENYRFYAMYLDNVSTAKILSLHITNNQIAPYGSLAKNAIVIRRHKYVAVNGNVGINSSTAAYAMIKFDSCDQINSTGNINAAGIWSGGVDTFYNACTYIDPYQIQSTTASVSALNFPGAPGVQSVSVWNPGTAGAPQLVFQPEKGNSTLVFALKPLGSGANTEIDLTNAATSFDYLSFGINGTHAYFGPLSVNANSKQLDFFATSASTLLTRGTMFVNGNWGLGTAGVDEGTGLLQVLKAGTQATLHYDASNKTDLATGSTGNLTITPSGGATTITGSANITGAHFNNITLVSATGTYNATATDYEIAFTGSTATLVYPTATTGRTLFLLNQASGSITLPTTTNGNGSTTTTLTTGQAAMVTYDGSVWRAKIW